jgi:ABC-type polysaccharide/polyol phosphate transport system ATPase subunit
VGNIAIRVSNLGKQYRIGAVQSQYGTFRDALSSVATELVLKLRGRAKTVDTIWALRNVTFEIQRGETIGVIGRNGAGKSTLLKVLSRITEPTCGEVDVYGRVGSLIEVGTGFHPELTGRENIYLNGAVLGMRRRDVRQKFDQIVAFSEVEKFIDTPVKHYSSGMYMRLAFAVAAHLEPEILIVDEVLAVGDAEFQKKCLAKIEDVARNGHTVLFVTHNMQPIQALCQRALWFDGGRLMAAGKVSDVVRQRMKYTLSNPGKDEGLYDVKVRTLDWNGNQLMEWRTDEELVIRVTIQGLVPSEPPVTVVSCYTVEGAWLFTLQSDMFPDVPQSFPGSELTLDFHIKNTAIATSEAYIDVGLRESGETRFVALYPRIHFFSIVSTITPHHQGSQPLLTLPASMQVISNS